MEQKLNPDNYSYPEDENIDIKRYVSLFISNWYWFVMSLFIALSLAYSINRYSQRIYSASASLLIKDDQIAGIKSSAESIVPGGDIFKSQQNLNNEMGILKSFSLNYRVIKELEDFHVAYIKLGRRGIVETRVYKDCPFKVVYDSLELEPKEIVGIKILSDTTYEIDLDGDHKYEFKKDIGKKFKENGFDFTIVPSDSTIGIYDKDNSNRYYFYFTDPESLAREYSSKLIVEPLVKDASIVTLSVSGLVGQQEVDYLNGLMTIYVKYGLENKNATADSTIRFIDDQIKLISASLTITAENLEKFRQANSFFDLSREGTLISTRLETLENAKASFDLQLQYYNYLSDYLSVKNPAGTIISPAVMGITDPVLLRLVNELSDIQKQKEKLGFNFEGNQPANELLDKQIEDAGMALKENIRNGIANLNLSIRESDRKIASVDSIINRLPTIEKKFVTIQRDFDLNNTVYTYLLEKRAESGIAKASNLPDNRIIDLASYYGPIKPKTRSNYMIAFLLGFIIPMLGMVSIDFLNDKVIDKKDVERKTKVPIIGYISHSEAKNELPVVEKPGSSLSESFRSVRTSLKYFFKENEKPVIAVSSTISSEGKTFISVNLAAITAMLGKKVLLVGLDMRKPRIDKIFQFDDSPGMSTYLSGNCGYDEVIKQTQIENLFYAPSGPVPPNPAELIEKDRMGEFIETVKKKFDVIIIDTPPLAIVTDALLLAPYVSINLFIVRQRYSSRNTLEIIEQLYRQGELKNMALIINDINISGYYGYGMRYGYSLGYGYSYGFNYYGKGYYGRYGYSDKTTGYYVDDK
jgi:tyrosine-protein kinase Etk/Wzc